VKCDEARGLLHPYADDDLDLVKTLDIETHLGDCHDCAGIHRNIVALRTSIRAAGCYHRAPAGLAARVRSNLPIAPASARMRWLRNRIAVTAAIVLIAATIGLSLLWMGDSSERLLASEVTSAHVRSLMVDHLWDVQSTDRHTVKPWFHGKLDFAPDVRDFSAASFPLEGARLDYLAGRPVAALVYRHERHYINLFIWPAPGQADRGEVATEQQGYPMVHWIRGGMNYWAVSDISAGGLRRFADVVRNGASAAATQPADAALQD
jgi:anti-sigma factor RsiW